MNAYRSEGSDFPLRAFDHAENAERIQRAADERRLAVVFDAVARIADIPAKELRGTLDRYLVRRIIDEIVGAVPALREAVRR